MPFTSKRPPKNKRLFSSPAVETAILEVGSHIADKELAWMFANCFPNTLDTTVFYSEKKGRPDSYIITGDIDAMWLRDSAAQIWPYIRFAKSDAAIKRLFQGAINKQAEFILLDPYANAFYNDPAKKSEWQSDFTDMKPGVHERKWEIDSLCAFVRMSHGYWKTTGDTGCFDARWKKAAGRVLKTLEDQKKMGGAYTFMRKTKTPNDTLLLGGQGSPTRECGLIRSAFRPSDDACIFPFLIPSNCFAALALKQLAEIYAAVLNDKATAKRCRDFGTSVETAVKKHGVVDSDNGTVLAFEVDGFGGRLLMDDSNVPSLLSLPYLGYCKKDDPLYRRTRGLIWSARNPYFFKGKAGEGIGGPHCGLDMIWPMSLIMRALTSLDEKEIVQSLKTLKATHAGTGFMHESFFKDNPAKFTRTWFGWVNSMFGELILTVWDSHRSLLKKAF